MKQSQWTLSFLILCSLESLLPASFRVTALFRCKAKDKKPLPRIRRKGFSLPSMISTALNIAQGQRGVGRRQFGQCVLKKAFFSLKKMVYVCAIIPLFMFAVFLPNWNNPNQALHSEQGSRALLPFSAHSFYHDLDCSQKNIGWFLFGSVFEENSCYK